MLVSGKGLLEYQAKTRDSSLGKVCGFYFDCDLWTINYLVVETQPASPLRQMPFSSVAITSVHQEERELFLDVTQAQVDNAPPWGDQLLCSRQKEVELHRHYHWSPYWLTRWVVQQDGDDTLYYRSNPVVMAEDAKNQATAIFLAEEPSLQSANTLFNCTFTLTSGYQATVMDVLVNLRNWRITNLIFARYVPASLSTSDLMPTTTPISESFPSRVVPIA